MIKYVKVYGKEYLHLWTYEHVKEKLNAKIIDYKTRGNLIEYVIYKVNLPEEYKNVKKFKYENIYIDVLDNYIIKEK